jgi:hypothetical protein
MEPDGIGFQSATAKRKAAKTAQEQDETAVVFEPKFHGRAF